MRKIITFTLCALSALSLGTAAAATKELTDCSQLQAKKAVLLVHSSYCGHCQGFLPVYEAVSDLPEMRGYTFYTKQDDSFAPVCGVAIDAVPVIFTHNMQQSAEGVLTKDELVAVVKQ